MAVFNRNITLADVWKRKEYLKLRNKLVFILSHFFFKLVWADVTVLSLITFSEDAFLPCHLELEEKRLLLVPETSSLPVETIASHRCNIKTGHISLKRWHLVWTTLPKISIQTTSFKTLSCSASLPHSLPTDQSSLFHFQAFYRIAAPPRP